MKAVGPWGVTFVAGVGLLAPGMLSLLGNSPNMAHPGSFLLVLPLFLGVPLALVFLVGPLLFWLWMPRLFRGSPQVPLRSLLLLLVVAALSFSSLADGWNYGARYQGVAFVHGILWINVLAVLVLGVLLFIGRRTPSFPTNLLAHWFLVAWLVTYAFPYLGELP